MQVNLHVQGIPFFGLDPEGRKLGAILSGLDIVSRLFPPMPSPVPLLMLIPSLG